MEVDVGHQLPSFPAAVHGNTVSSVRQPLAPGHLAGDMDQMAQEFPVFRAGLSQRRDVLPGQDQQVVRCLGIDVTDDHCPVILIDEIARYLAADNLAEDAIRHLSLPQG